jgi:acyl-CoA reductase-like NAD-dependent aldehyde dehydrogenase
MFIDGRVRDGVDGATFEHVNPATGATQWNGVLPGPADVDEAVRSCGAAQAEWRRTDPEVRGAVLERAAAAMAAHEEGLAALATAEAGVPTSLARTVAAVRPAAVCRYYAGWADKVQGEVLPIFPKAGFDYTRLEPHGTIAVVVPWRNPLLASAAQVSAALAAGNCVVLNPSPLAPFTSVRLAELFSDVGLPPGVLNVVPGGIEATERLAGHRGIDKILGAAEPAAARRVMQAAAKRLTPVTVETGGAADHIVFGDADLAAAARAIVLATFVAPTGPGLAPPARLLASEAVADELAEIVAAGAAELRVGDPLDPATDVGPLINAATCARTEAVVARAATNGLLLDGGQRLGGALSAGFFLSPALIQEGPSAAAAASEDVGGPVLTLSRFGSDDEALALANRSAGGFRGGVYTSDLGRTHRFAARLASGAITVNGPECWSSAGGGAHEGRVRLMESVRIKNVFVDLSV